MRTLPATLVLWFLASVLVGCSSFNAESSAPGPVEPGQDAGTVVGGDAGAEAGSDGGVITGSPADTSLASLSISAATIAPAFVPATLIYTAGPARVSDVLLTTTTVTATARAAGTQITVNGVAAASGKPSAPVSLKVGATPIDIKVTAADGVTQTHYTVVVAGTAATEPSDYLKASDTRAGGHFGATLAVSGSTLAVSGNAGVYVFTRSGTTWSQQAYLTKAGGMGTCVALSGDTLAASAADSSNATGVNGSETDTSMPGAGGVYVFTRTGTTWSQQAYVKPSNTRAGMRFGLGLSSVVVPGYGLALSGDTLAVGAGGESSSATGVNGNQADTASDKSGAVYVFTRTGTAWSQQAYVKASNTRASAEFGGTLALSGSTLAVGAGGESSDATGVNGNQATSSMPNAGAVYTFTRTGTTWSQQAYLKASNTRASAYFGSSIALAGDTLAVGSYWESSIATGVNGDQVDTSGGNAGAAYVFTRAGTTWSQQAYLKASNTRANMHFGSSIALSGDTLAVGAEQETSNAKGVNGNQADASTTDSGAVYVFARSGTTWSQRAYVKASNTRGDSFFSSGIGVSEDTLAVGSFYESSSAKGVNGNQADTSMPAAGAVYVLR